MRYVELHRGYVRAVAFSPDGRLLATGSNDRTVKVVEVATRSVVAQWERFRHLILTVAWSPDGATLAAGHWGEVALLEVASHAAHSIHVTSGGMWTVSGLAFAPD